MCSLIFIISNHFFQDQLMADDFVNQQQIVAEPPQAQWVYNGGDSPICRLPDLLLVYAHFVSNLLN